jgi:hypothetical protein
MLDRLRRMEHFGSAIRADFRHLKRLFRLIFTTSGLTIGNGGRRWAVRPGPERRLSQSRPRAEPASRLPSSVVYQIRYLPGSNAGVRAHAVTRRHGHRTRRGAPVVRQLRSHMSRACCPISRSFDRVRASDHSAGKDFYQRPKAKAAACAEPIDGQPREEARPLVQSAL